MNKFRLKISYGFALLTFARIITSLVFICMLASSAGAAELIMFDRQNCQWSTKWHAEIGADAYNATPEGRTAPLRVVDVGKTLPTDLKFVGEIVDTPTFVLVENGAEIDRLVGYPGLNLFFGKLISMLNRSSGADRRYKTIIVQ